MTGLPAWEIRVSPGRVRGKDGPHYFCAECEYEVWRGYFIARPAGNSNPAAWLCLTCTMAHVRASLYQSPADVCLSDQQEVTP